MNIQFRVNERSRHEITATFTDAAGDPVDPPARYRIDDATNGESVRADTPITVTGGQATIVLTPDDNAMLDESNAEELRVVTVTANPGTDDEYNQVIRYVVENLTYVLSA